MSILKVTNSIEIDAPAEKIWKILTQSEFTKQYMFGCAVISDWKKGSTLDWKMKHEGKDFIPVTGNIVTYQPVQKFDYTVIDPHADYPVIPENHLLVENRLEEKNGKTVLTVTQSGFEGVADGQKRYKDVSNNGDGWNPILEQIKKIAEEF